MTTPRSDSISPRSSNASVGSWVSARSGTLLSPRSDPLRSPRSGSSGSLHSLAFTSPHPGSSLSPQVVPPLSGSLEPTHSSPFSNEVLTAAKIDVLKPNPPAVGTSGDSPPRLRRKSRFSFLRMRKSASAPAQRTSMRYVVQLITGTLWKVSSDWDCVCVCGEYVWVWWVRVGVVVRMRVMCWIDDDRECVRSGWNQLNLEHYDSPEDLVLIKSRWAVSYVLRHSHLLVGYIVSLFNSFTITPHC